MDTVKDALQAIFEQVLKNVTGAAHAHQIDISSIELSVHYKTLPHQGATGSPVEAKGLHGGGNHCTRCTKDGCSDC